MTTGWPTKSYSILGRLLLRDDWKSRRKRSNYSLIYGKVRIIILNFTVTIVIMIMTMMTMMMMMMTTMMKIMTTFSRIIFIGNSTHRTLRSCGRSMNLSNSPKSSSLHQAVRDWIELLQEPQKAWLLSRGHSNNVEASTTRIRDIWNGEQGDV